MQVLLEAIENDRLIALPDNDKRSALTLLSQCIQDADALLGPDTRIVERVLKREAQAITYMGFGIACPHARTEGDGDLLCAIGWNPKGIPYGNDDGVPVRLILLFFVPDARRHHYLQTISALARMLKRHERLSDWESIHGVDALRLRLIEWASVAKGQTDPGLASGETERSRVLSQVLLPEIVDLLEVGRLSDVRGFLTDQPAPEIADLIAAVTDKFRVLMFRLLPRALADEVFALLDHPAQNLLLQNMAHEEIRQVISALSPDDRTALFEELPAQVTQRLLGLLSDQDRRQALTLLSYPESSVGRLMTNRYVAVRAEWTVAQAMDHIRKFGTDSETMATVYVIDEQGALKDDLLLRKLILANPTDTIASLLDGHAAALHSLQDREEAVQMFKKYDESALPVVDGNGIMLGIVTSDDILDVAEEEATEDIHRSVAINPLDVSYLRAPLAMLYRRRISWLVILVFVNIFSGAGIAFFEELIASTVALVFFLPLLIDSGGNAGVQAATLVIRSMALGEMKSRNYLRVMWRELRVAIGLGLSMSVAGFLLAWWRAGLPIGMVVGCSMAVIVIISSVIGASLPFVLRRLGYDPAIASAPLLTSLSDILGVLIYLGIASAWLGALAQ